MIGGAAVVGGAVKLGKAAVNTAADFESQMNTLTVAARSSGTSLEDLRAVSLKTGADTSLVGISASQSAEALENFYKAGLDTADIFGGSGGLNAYLEEGAELSGALRAAVDLQAASELNLAQASDVIAIAMATYGLGAEDATRITDNFVQAADASVASVPELAAALANVGPVASSMGLSLEETNNALGILSSAGIRGAEAGTVLKSFLNNMIRPTDAVTGALAKLDTKLYDSQGNMRAFPDILEDMSKGMAKLTQEEKDAAISAVAGSYGKNAMIQLTKDGAASWGEMLLATESAATAAEVSEGKTQGLNAAMEALGGTIETFMITAGTPLIEKFLTPLIKNAAKIGETVIPELEGIIAALSGEAVTDMSPTVEIFVSIAESMTGLKEATTELKDAWAELKATLGLASDEQTEQVEKFTILESALKNVKVLAETVFAPLTHGLKAISSLLKGDFKTAMEEMNKAVSAPGDIAVRAIESNVEAVTGKEQDFETAGKGLFDSLFGPFEETGLAKALGVGLVTDLASGLEDTDGLVKAEAEARAADIITPIEGIDLVATSTAITAGLATGLEDADGKVKAEAEARMTDIKTPLEGIDAVQIGTDFIIGLADGIKAKADTYLKEKAEGVANLLPLWVKKALGIASPSTEGYDVGYNFGESLGLGVAGAVPTLSSPMGDMMAMFDNMVNWLYQLATVVAPTMSLFDLAEALEDFTDVVEDLAHAFVMFVEASNAVATAKFKPADFYNFLDQYVEVAKVVQQRFLALYKEIGDKDIKRAENAAERLGNALQSVIVNFDDLKPGDMSVVLLYVDQVEQLIRATAAMLERIVAGPGGLGGATLSTLEQWAKELTGIFVLLGQDMASFSVNDAKNFGEIVTAYFEQLGVVALTIKTWLGGTDSILMEAYDTAAQAAGYISGMLTLLGTDLALKIPEMKAGYSWIDTFETWLGYLQHAFDKINGWIDTIEKMSRDALETAVPVAQNITSMLGLLGTGIEIQLPEMKAGYSWAKAFATWLRYIKHATGQIKGWIDTIEKTSRDALVTAGPVADNIIQILGLLGVSIELQIPAMKAGYSWADAFETWLRYIKHAAGNIRGWIDTIEQTTRDALVLAVPVAQNIASMLGLLGTNIAIQMPEVEKGHSWISDVSNWIDYFAHATKEVLVWIDGLKTTTKDALALAAPVAQNITSMLGILGTDLALKMPELKKGHSWPSDVSNWFDYLAHATEEALVWINGLKTTTKAALALAAPVAQNITSLLSILGTDLKIEGPTGDFGAQLKSFFAALKKVARATMRAIGDIQGDWDNDVLKAAAEASESIQGALGILGIDFWRGGEGLGFASSAAILEQEMGWLLDDIAAATEMIVDPESGLPYIAAQWGDALTEVQVIGTLIKAVFDSIAGAVESAASAIETGLDVTGLMTLLSQMQQVATAAGNLSTVPQAGTPAKRAGGGEFAPPPGVFGGGGNGGTQEHIIRLHFMSGEALLQEISLRAADILQQDFDLYIEQTLEGAMH